MQVDHPGRGRDAGVDRQGSAHLGAQAAVSKAVFLRSRKLSGDQETRGHLSCGAREQTAFGVLPSQPRPSVLEWVVNGALTPSHLLHEASESTMKKFQNR